jgi:hypothetical protein
MIRESLTAVIARNEPWSGAVATEPYEAGWASEAVVFVRALAVKKIPGSVKAKVQISPDGMNWVDEGTRFNLPSKPQAVTFARVREFGNWLRIVAELPKGASMKAVVTLQLK